MFNTYEFRYHSIVLNGVLCLDLCVIDIFALKKNYESTNKVIWNHLYNVIIIFVIIILQGFF